MHGPGHLFCGGTVSEALAAAAWAGYCIAKEQHERAAEFVHQAHRSIGEVAFATPMQDGGQLEIRCVRGKLSDPQDALFMAEVLTSFANSAKKRAMRKAEEAARQIEYQI